MTKKQKKTLIRIIVTTVLLIVIAIAENTIEFPNNDEIQAVPWDELKSRIILVMYLFPYAIIGYDILKKAYKGIVHGQVLDENFLMAVATIGSMILGEYREGVMVMLLYQIGELFQSVKSLSQSDRCNSNPQRVLESRNWLCYVRGADSRSRGKTRNRNCGA